VLRPFVGRVDEADLVALRELVPSASAPLTLSSAYLAEHPEHAGTRVTLGTMLPQAAPALVRDTGEILLALQSAVSGLDAAADVAGALLAALAAKPGSVVDVPPASALTAVERGPDGLAGLPRLTDLLDPAPLEITVHPGFDWWLPADEPGAQAPSGEVATGLEQANASVVPTARLRSVRAAYWCRPGERTHLRWVLPFPTPPGADADGPAAGPAAGSGAGSGADVPVATEEDVLDALARLAAEGRLTVGDGSRFVGSFRAAGLMVPVWDLPADAEAEDCEEPAAGLWTALVETLAAPRPLTAEERRIRAGVVGRTLTLR
jgi:hypothetical protein